LTEEQICFIASGGERYNVAANETRIKTELLKIRANVAESFRHKFPYTICMLLIFVDI